MSFYTSSAPVALVWSISHPEPGIPLLGLGNPKPHWRDLGRRGGGGLQLRVPHAAAGHMGVTIPCSSHRAGSWSPGRSSLAGPKEKLDTLGGSEHHFTEGLDTC